jgi:hypothetical protein
MVSPVNGNQGSPVSVTLQKRNKRPTKNFGIVQPLEFVATPHEFVTGESAGGILHGQQEVYAVLKSTSVDSLGRIAEQQRISMDHRIVTQGNTPQTLKSKNSLEAFARAIRHLCEEKPSVS